MLKSTPFFLCLLCLLPLVSCRSPLHARNSEPFDISLQGDYFGPPLWSPDGKHIAFSCEELRGGRDNLCILDTETSEVSRIIIEDGISFRSGAYWENKDVLWFVYKAPDNEIFSHSIGYYDISNGEFHDFVNLDAVFAMKHEGASGITVDLSRQEVVLALLLKGNDNTSISSELYSIGLTDKSITRLTDTPNIYEEAPIWLSSTDTLAYMAFDDLTHTLSIHIGDPETVLPVDAPMTPHAYTFSPDGRWILFVGRYDAPGLYLIATDARLVSHDDFAYLSWSPDGNQLVYTMVGVPGRNELRVVSSQQLGLSDLLNSSQSSQIIQRGAGENPAK